MQSTQFEVVYPITLVQEWTGPFNPQEKIPIESHKNILWDLEFFMGFLWECTNFHVESMGRWIFPLT